MNFLGIPIETYEWMDKDKVGLTNGKELKVIRMNETKEIDNREISIVGWWAVYADGKPIAAFNDKDRANTFVNRYVKSVGDWIEFQIQQIAKKVPFESDGLFLVKDGQVTKINTTLDAVSIITE